jgi:hypothetical protein
MFSLRALSRRHRPGDRLRTRLRPGVLEADDGQAPVPETGHDTPPDEGLWRFRVRTSKILGIAPPVRGRVSILPVSICTSPSVLTPSAPIFSQNL